MGWTRAKYLDFLRLQCDEMTAIAGMKNADYCGTDPDAFSNFAKVEALGIASVEQGFLTRMTDKLCRINSFVQKGVLEVKDESVSDTLLDLANYCILMMGYIQSKRDEKTDQVPGMKINRPTRPPPTKIRI